MVYFKDPCDILDTDGLKELASEVKELISTYRFEHYKSKLKNDVTNSSFFRQKHREDTYENYS